VAQNLQCIFYLFPSRICWSKLKEVKNLEVESSADQKSLRKNRLVKAGKGEKNGK
jgi:hypothetical protein